MISVKPVVTRFISNLRQGPVLLAVILQLIFVDSWSYGSPFEPLSDTGPNVELVQVADDVTGLEIVWTISAIPQPFQKLPKDFSVCLAFAKVQREIMITTRNQQYLQSKGNLLQARSLPRRTIDSEPSARPWSV